MKKSEERKLKEKEKFKLLLSETDRWYKAKIMRRYIRYIENNRILKDAGWIALAKAKADWFDPLVAKVDDILGIYRE